MPCHLLGTLLNLPEGAGILARKKRQPLPDGKASSPVQTARRPSKE